MVISPNKWELDVQGYLNLCNITSATPRQQIRDFAAGVNDLGLWNSMVCWPLRSSQNAGTGTTAFSLGGLGAFNGTLVNGPTWGADGVTTDGIDDHAEMDIPTSSAWTAIAIIRRLNNSDTEARNYWGLVFSGQTAGYDGVTYYLKDGGLGIFQSANGFTNWSPSRPAANATTNMGFQTVAYAESGPSAVTSLNGTFSTQSSVGNLSSVRHNKLRIGNNRFSNNRHSNAEHAFYGYITSQLSNSTVESLRSLYKSTLGTGLGLP